MSTRTDIPDKAVEAAHDAWLDARYKQHENGVAAMRAALSAASPFTGAVVKPLEWEPVLAARSKEDPTPEETGEYETVCAVGVYYIEMYFGSDSYGWCVTLNGADDIADKDDPDDAKAAAQADYEARIRSALVPSPVPQEALPLDRDTLGRMVREAWVRWAMTQPTPKASWLVPYDELAEADKEADRQIGEAIAKWTITRHNARFSPAAPAAPNWSGWRSIDTAPEDEHVILATSGGFVGEALMLIDEDTGQQKWTWALGPVHPNHTPYGWQPMPSSLTAPVVSDLRPGGFDGPTGAD